MSDTAMRTQPPQTNWITSFRSDQTPGPGATPPEPPPRNPTRAEGFYPVRLELVGLPDPLDAAAAETADSGHFADAPVGAAWWLLMQGLVHDLLDGLRIQRRLASRAGRVPPQPVDALDQIALLPAGHRDLALANRAGDRHHPNTLRRQQHNPCPPDEFLRRVPPAHPLFQRRPIPR